MTKRIKSVVTELMLSESLKKMLFKKQLSEITISMLIKDCHINRNTFYYHFESKYALLKFTMEQDVSGVVQSINPNANIENAVRTVLTYIDNNRPFLCNAYYSLSHDEMRNNFYCDMKGIMDVHLKTLNNGSRVPMQNSKMQFLSLFFTGGISYLMLDYLFNPKRWANKDIVGYTLQILNCFESYINK